MVNICFQFPYIHITVFYLCFLCLCVVFRLLVRIKYLQIESFNWLLQIVIQLKDGKYQTPKAMAEQVVTYLEENGYLKA